MAGAQRIAGMLKAQPTSPGVGGTLADTARSVWGGALTGLEGINRIINPATTVGEGIKAFAPVLPTGAQGAVTAAGRFLTGESVTSALGGGYQPKTAPGHVGQLVGQMLPNAIAPEGAAAKLASVVLPAGASYGMQQLAKAMGAGPKGQAVAQFGGGILGGAAAGVGSAQNAAQVAPKIISSAEEPVAQSIRSALAMDGTTPVQALQGVASGKLPLTASPGLGQLAETVAQQPGVGAVKLADAVGQRMAGARDRALQAVTTHLGVDPAAAQGDVQSIVQQGRQSVGPAYDALRTNPAPVWNPDLAALAQRPAIKMAIGVAADQMLNEGKSPTVAGFQIDPDTGAWVLPKSGSLEGITEQQPTAETWIKVHQALGNTVERSPLNNKPIPDSLSPGNYGIRTSGSALGSALTDAIPGYGDVLSQSGDYLSVNGAFDRASKRLFNGPVSQFGDMWGSLSNPAEQNAARASVANDILTRSEGGSFLPGQFKSPGVQQKLAIAFGPDAASNFTDQMESDLAERGVYNRVLQGSPTARRTNLEAAFQAQNAPSGMGAKFASAIQGGTGLADTIASLTHPVTAITRTAALASKALGGGEPAAPPWQNPEANAQLGQVLSDPGAFSDLLSRMSLQDALDASQITQRQGALRGIAGAAPGLLSGVIAPPAATAAPGPQPQ